MASGPPLHHALEAIHHGPHDRMDDASAAVREACAALGYTPSGPVTEIYEVTRGDGVPAEDDVTRVRLPTPAEHPADAPDVAGRPTRRGGPLPRRRHV